ncbi:hypothetical protein ACH5RR_014266 [Cinchona calisaya]|uniref:PGG domain-containing protein n=1 Tax=Cinchona calisaya TaxID=153742 RepID=A0ABD3A2G6_9GENT
MASAERGTQAAAGIVPEELNEDNYEDWKICLKHFLVGHGLWGVVSGNEPEPSKDANQEHEEWTKKNALALHAIQLSCGPNIYSKFKEAQTSSKAAWDHLAEKRKLPTRLEAAQDPEDKDIHVEDGGSREHYNDKALYNAIEKKDLRQTKILLAQDGHAVRARISSHKDTALHIAILAKQMKIVNELMRRMGPEDMEITNEYGSTPLTLAAISGLIELAKALVLKNRKLLRMTNDREDGQLPVIVAALYSQKSMVRYLYSVTPEEELSPERNGTALLNSLITAEIYDVASMLLKRFPRLGVTPDHRGDYPLGILAHRPSAFTSGTKLVFWKRWIYLCILVLSPWRNPRGSLEDESMQSMQTQSSVTIEDQNIDIDDYNDDEMTRTICDLPQFTSQVLKILHRLGWRILRCLVPDVKEIRDRKWVNDQAITVLSSIFQEIHKLNKLELENMDIDKILFDAIENGIIEFVLEISESTPEIIWRKDKKGRTIFSHAITLRQEKIYSLIYTLGTKKSILARRHDIFGNNFLHLAAKLSPPSQLDRVSGAALQMQRELQWFQEVESIVQPRLKEEKNENNKTPSDLFTDEHKVLVKEGERWMKNTAGSSMIVGTLISAVMFTTAFSVPGGNDNKTGLPVLLETESKAFLVFMASNALSMFTSSTSILMFLGILTARYTEKDFLKSLPTKLLFGIACLFGSIVTMMLSFGTALYMMLVKQVAWVSYPIIVFSIIPIALFSLLQFPLLVEMSINTYGSGIFDKPKGKFFRFDS